MADSTWNKIKSWTEKTFDKGVDLIKNYEQPDLEKNVQVLYNNRQKEDGKFRIPMPSYKEGGRVNFKKPDPSKTIVYSSLMKPNKLAVFLFKSNVNSLKAKRERARRATKAARKWAIKSLSRYSRNAKMAKQVKTMRATHKLCLDEGMYSAKSDRAVRVKARIARLNRGVKSTNENDYLSRRFRDPFTRKKRPEESVLDFLDFMDEKYIAPATLAIRANRHWRDKSKK
ncbi:hypothetical protein JKY72_06420 [Candidatus Gracilibacteria bacterium]|nr:hypothetical protein [Candidatus Gracilibacteria bacterium]